MESVSEEKFFEIEKQGLLFVDFFATWCGPCRMMSPIVERLDKELDGVKVVKVDVDECENAAKKYGVMMIPTCILLKDGKEVMRTVGAKTFDEIFAEVKKYMD